jgi:hypothetical protein
MEWFVAFLLDRTRSLSWPDASGQCIMWLPYQLSDRTRIGGWPDAQVTLSTVNTARVSDRTRWASDRTRLQCIRSTVKMEQRGSSEGFERPDMSSHPWSDLLCVWSINVFWNWSRPLSMTGRVRSHRPARPVGTKNAELAHNGWDWVGGINTSSTHPFEVSCSFVQLRNNFHVHGSARA